MLLQQRRQHNTRVHRLGRGGSDACSCSSRRNEVRQTPGQIGGSSEQAARQ
jgi:hypothetical protein